MKTFFLLFILLPVISKAQSSDDAVYGSTAPVTRAKHIRPDIVAPGKIYYDSVIHTDGSMSDTVLFDNAKKFIIDYGTTYNTPIQQERNRMRDYYQFDEAGKTVFANMRTIVEQGFNNTLVGFSMNVECRNGRYKFTLTDFKVFGTMLYGMVTGNTNFAHGAPLEDAFVNGRHKALRKKFEENINAIIAKFETAMSKKENNNW